MASEQVAAAIQSQSDTIFAAEINQQIRNIQMVSVVGNRINVYVYRRTPQISALIQQYPGYQIQILQVGLMRVLPRNPNY